MAKLGEAYVRVRADLEPFAKDLDKGLKAITDRFEKALNREAGRTYGKNMGGGIRDGLKESGKDIDGELNRLSIPANNRRRGRRAGQDFGAGFNDGLFGTLAKASSGFITALEDGFSSLPPQIKAIAGAALVAAIVPAGALLSAAVGAALVAGTVGIGVALSSQFAEVEADWKNFTDRIREQAVRAAEPFAGEVVASLSLFEDKLEALDPQIRSLFSNASKYVEPFARGIAGAVEGLITGLDRGLQKADLTQISATIEDGLTNIGQAFGEAFEKILANPNLAGSLEDLLRFVEDIVDVGGEFLNWTLDAWAAFKDFAEVAERVVDVLGSVVQVLNDVFNAGSENWAEDLSESWDGLVESFTGKNPDQIRVAITRIDEAGREWNNTTSATIKQTKEQEKALKELNAAMDAQLRLTNDVIGTQIDYQAAIDQTTEDLIENGKTLDLRDEKGRENAENVQREINALREQVQAQLDSGKLTEDQAKTFFNAEIARIRARFKGNKEVLAQFDALFAKLTTLQAVPPVPNKLGPFAQALASVIAALDKIIARQRTIAGNNNIDLQPSSHNQSGVGAGQQKYAEGGLITEPTSALMGENYRPEMVLPLTNTRRSMQLLSRSPLAGMLGGNTNVAVYLGNEQLIPQMVKVSTATNRAAARTLSQAPRMV